MRRKMSSKHNFWGAPSGPPCFVPVIDPGEVWADESLHYVCGLRLDRDEFRVVQEAMGQEPLGRYGDFPDGSDYFWAFRSADDLRAATERGHAKLLELRPPTVAEAAAEPAPAVESSCPHQTRPPMMSDEELFDLAEKRGVAPIVIIWEQMDMRSEEHTSELQSRQYLVC